MFLGSEVLCFVKSMANYQHKCAFTFTAVEWRSRDRASSNSHPITSREAPVSRPAASFVRASVGRTPRPVPSASTQVPVASRPSGTAAPSCRRRPPRRRWPPVQTPPPPPRPRLQLRLVCLLSREASPEPIAVPTRLHPTPTRETLSERAPAPFRGPPKRATYPLPSPRPAGRFRYRSHCSRSALRTRPPV